MFLLNLFFFISTAHAAASETCSFVQSSVQRSGPLPYAGTLEQQKEGILESQASSKSSMKFSRILINGRDAYRFRFIDGDQIVENVLYNKGTSSYQLTLVSTKQEYRKQLRNLRTLMRHPYDENTILCR